MSGLGRGIIDTKGRWTYRSMQIEFRFCAGDQDCEPVFDDLRGRSTDRPGDGVADWGFFDIMHDSFARASSICMENLNWLAFIGLSH